MLKFLSFGLCGILTVVMMVATVADKVWGNAVAMEWFYAAPWTIALWVVTAVASGISVIRYRRRLNGAAMLLHVSFIIILAGAAITHYAGEQGRMVVQAGECVGEFETNDGLKVEMPMTISLKQCRIECYRGTSTPMDYASDLTVTRHGVTTDATVSMNNVLSIAGYRFYQSGMGEGYTVLSVSHDPWGIGVTYSGYGLLLLSMAAFFFSPHSRFRQLVKAVACVVAVMLPGVAGAVEKGDVPPTLQRGLARDFGRMLVFYNGRVCPVQTLARDFCIKMCGSSTYRGLTPEQVLTGWLFYYNDWKDEPMIGVKGGKVVKALGINGKFASLNDFYSAGEFKLDSGEGEIPERDVRDAIEKTALISSVCTGAVFKIYPVVSDDGSVEWVSWVDELPAGMDIDDKKFLLGSMEYVAREIAHGRNVSADDALKRIASRQIEILGDGYGPDSLKYKAEMVYNWVSHTLAVGIVAIICGLASFIVYCRATARGTRQGACVTGMFTVLLVVILMYVSCVMVLRGIIGGQLPLGNGHETMLALAWVGLLTGLVLSRRFRVMQPASLIIAGMAMMVAMMGEKNPQVSHLMPVLQSPLLSVHVMVIMISYSLLLFIALNSIASIAVGLNSEASARLANLSKVILYPAVFLLAAGIFIGAVWANQSWGRYWGWDPKETWALVTLLIYALPLHAVSFPRFNRPPVVHIYLLVALLSVAMTYLGVNLLLPGLHSYA